MKKIFITCLVLLGLILCSCNATMVPNGDVNEIDSTTQSFMDQNNPSPDIAHESKDSESQTSSALPEEKDTALEENASETVPSYSGDPVWFRLSDYTLYQKWIRTAEVPDNFVSYEQIKELGEEFHDFVIRSVGDDFTVYHYNLKINGKKVMIEVRNYDDKYSLKSTYEGTAPQNLRHLDESVSGYLVVNDIEYRYYSGDLYYIKWKQQDNLVVTIALENAVDLPTSDLPPALADLLDSTTAADALASIKASINTPVTE